MAGHQIGASTIAGLLFNLYDRYRQNQDASGLSDFTSDVAGAKSPEDVSDFQQIMNTYNLGEGGVHVANTIADQRSKELSSQSQAGELSGMFERYATEYGKYAKAARENGEVPTPGDFLQQNPGMASSPNTNRLGRRYAAAPDVLESMGKAVTQGDADAVKVSKMQDKIDSGETAAENAKNFLSSVSMLLLPRDKTPRSVFPGQGETELDKNKSRGGYAAPAETISDVMQAASEYPVSSSTLQDVLNQVMKQGKETYPPESRKTEKLGRTTATIDYNLFGEPKRTETSVQPVEKGKTPEQVESEREKRNIANLKLRRIATVGKAAYTPQEKAANQAALDAIDAELAAYGAMAASAAKPVASHTPGAAGGYTWKNGKMIKN